MRGQCPRNLCLWLLAFGLHTVSCLLKGFFSSCDFPPSLQNCLKPGAAGSAEASFVHLYSEQLKLLEPFTSQASVPQGCSCVLAPLSCRGPGGVSYSGVRRSPPWPWGIPRLPWECSRRLADVFRGADRGLPRATGECGVALLGPCRAQRAGPDRAVCDGACLPAACGAGVVGGAEVGRPPLRRSSHSLLGHSRLL